jgi:hypothetical protein
MKFCDYRGAGFESNQGLIFFFENYSLSSVKLDSFSFSLDQSVTPRLVLSKVYVLRFCIENLIDSPSTGRNGMLASSDSNLQQTGW